MAEEKTQELKGLFGGHGIIIEGFFSNLGKRKISEIDIAVCTIEKANGIINRMLEEKSLGQISAMIVDELHFLGENGRGSLLEVLMAKIKYSNTGIQIVGLSATLPNINDLCSWLDAEYYKTDFRPIPLDEFIVWDGNVMSLRSHSFKSYPEVERKFVEKNDELVFLLCKEAVVENHSVLIFCPSKERCEKLCNYLICYNIVHEENLTSVNNVAKIIEELRISDTGLDKQLMKSIYQGVAFHHAGLSSDERRFIECMYRRNYIKVICCTTTLSAGVNLPAQRVIISSENFHGKLIENLLYYQMVGRAGRMNQTSSGMSFLICNQPRPALVEKLQSMQLEPLTSRLGDFDDRMFSSNVLTKFILELIVTNAGGASITDLEAGVSNTFYAAQLGYELLRKKIDIIIKYLIANEFLNPLINDNMQFRATKLGISTVFSSMPPGEALIVYQDLCTAKKSLVLDTELHLVYLTTPTFQLSGLQPNWTDYCKILAKLSEEDHIVADRVGVEESFISHKIYPGIKNNRKELIHVRFFAALMLNDLVHEVPLKIVVKKYSINRAQIQTLRQTAASFAGMVTVFCQKLGKLQFIYYLSRTLLVLV